MHVSTCISTILSLYKNWNGRKYVNMPRLKSKKFFFIHINEYDKAPYFIQFSKNLTCDCWFLCFPPNLLELNLKLFCSEINKQSHVKFWLNWIKYGAASYSLSCNWFQPIVDGEYCVRKVTNHGFYKGDCHTQSHLSKKLKYLNFPPR